MTKQKRREKLQKRHLRVTQKEAAKKNAERQVGGKEVTPSEQE